MDMDRGDAIDDFTDTPGELACSKLAFLAEQDKAAAHLRDDDALDADHEGSEYAEPEILQDDEEQRRRCLHAQECRLNKGITDEATQGFDLILDHGCDFCRFQTLEHIGREPQDPVDKFESQPTQHAFAEPAFVCVDIELEETVDDYEDEKGNRQGHQHVEPVELEALEQNNGLACTDPVRQIEGNLEKSLSRARRVETIAL